jgi:hypothetical protein
MSVEGRCAIRADDPKVLKPVVVSDTVLVVEDHRHVLPSPHLSLVAQLTARFLQALFIEASLQVAARIGGVFDQDLAERALGPSDALHYAGIWVEVVGGDIPQRGVLLQSFRVPAGGAVPKVPQRFSPRMGSRDRAPRF